MLKIIKFLHLCWTSTKKPSKVRKSRFRDDLGWLWWSRSWFASPKPM